MELYERLDLTLINYLNKMDYDTFKLHCQTSCKNEGERKIKYNMLKNFCAVNIKAKGEVRRLYSYTLATPIEVGGRLYCGNSIQGLSRQIRGLLCKNMTDIDMKSAHLCIAQWLCKQHNVDCPQLSYYIDNRSEICQRFGDYGKTLFLCALNDEKLNKKNNDSLFKAFDLECKKIQKAINSKEEYKHIVETVPFDKAHNWNGSAFNRIMCTFENKILQEVITVINSKQIEIGVLMFDGLMVYGNHYDNEQLLRDIEDHVNNIFKGLNMVFTYKQHDTTIVLPKEIETYDEERSNKDCYINIKKEFEKKHAKIINKALFAKESEDGNVIFIPAHKFKIAYDDMVYKDYKSNPPSSQQFITKWFHDPLMRKYEDIGNYPPPLKCPKNMYNIWRPFAIEKYTDEYVKNEDGLQKFKNHIKILCGNDETVTDYLIKWIAQMFQYPATKTIVPTFISKPGAGKGTLLELMSLLMGGQKTLVTTQPSREVWGQFNGLMSDCFLVNLNELSKKETLDSDGKIKGLITDPQLTINKKGIDSYVINSCHRFICTTNNEDPVTTDKEDRRNVIIRSSDEKIGDHQYFIDLRETINDIDTQRTIYDFLMSIPDLDNFVSILKPITEHHKDAMEQNRSYYDRWIESMVRNNIEEKIIKYLGHEQCHLFTEWISQNKLTYTPNSIKMALAIKRLKIDGITCGVAGSKGNYTIYDIQKIKKHYSIGCKIDLNNL
jgi:sporulation protein YlmC with PRC-barrel domain